MDPLSDLLRVVRFDGAYFFNVEAAAPWSIETVAARELSPRIMPRAEHLISYHVIVSGSCWAGLPGKERVELNKGDVIVFPRGDPHVMSSEARGQARLRAWKTRRFASHVRLGPDAPRAVQLVCGFLGCDRRPFNPLLAALPRRLHIPCTGTDWAMEYQRQLTEETHAGRPGANLVLTRLAELMFVTVLRRYLEDLPEQETGWLAGLRDAVVGRALALLHARPDESWTLEKLARESETSRSNLAKRFAHFVKQPPMHYLAKWRMQIAANRLAQGDEKIAAIAESVGYDSEAAFNRAFKKFAGSSPGAWRDRTRDAAV